MSIMHSLPPFALPYPVSLALSISPGAEVTTIKLSCGHSTSRNSSFTFTEGQALTCLQCRDGIYNDWFEDQQAQLELAMSRYGC